MRQGFVKVAAVTPKIRVADTGYNAKVICQSIKEAAEAGAKVIVLPELCITGYTCGDLFLQEKLLREAKQELLNIAAFTINVDAIVFVGLPLAVDGELYNVDGNSNRVAAILYGPKSVILVCGYNKIVKNIDEAIDRVKRIAAPSNTIRLNIETPCGKTGKCITADKEGAELCSGCKSDRRICCNYVVCAQQRHKDRIKVIIIGEKYGY